MSIPSRHNIPPNANRKDKHLNKPHTSSRTDLPTHKILHPKEHQTLFLHILKFNMEIEFFAEFAQNCSY